MELLYGFLLVLLFSLTYKLVGWLSTSLLESLERMVEYFTNAMIAEFAFSLQSQISLGLWQDAGRSQLRRRDGVSTM